MIERLVLRDFQLHAKTKIDLDPNVTTIVGASDHGKSSVLRAIRWLATNRPGGESFVRQGQKFAKVVLKVDSHEIKRTKGKGRNTYALDGKLLKAFNTDVPESISKLLNLDDANFQDQYDKPFWFSDSAGTVSKSLNQIINLGTIDDTLSNLASMQREASAQVNAATALAADAESTWNKLKSMKSIGKELDAVEVLEASAVQARDNATLLDDLLADVAKHEERGENARAALLAGTVVEGLGAAWANACMQRDALEGLIAEADKYAKLAGTEIPDLDPLTALAEDYRLLCGQRDALQLILADVGQLTTMRNSSEYDIDVLQEQFEQQLGERCPLCGRTKKTRS